ncbi:ATP-dependent Lon protease, partial [Dolichospermum sp. ST_sed9]|nr:ATP-dependent Lon protease [Dolichospermum sp. ST_sed9]
MIGTFKLELQAVPGSGKLTRTGVASATKIKDSLNIAMNYFKANAQRVSSSIHPSNWDFLLQLLDLQGTGIPEESGLALFISLCSAALKRSVQTQLAIFGEMTLGGTITPVNNLAGSLQVAFDAGAKRILLPMSSAVDIASVPPELFTKFQTSFYTDPVDAVFKALAVD